MEREKVTKREKKETERVRERRRRGKKEKEKEQYKEEGIGSKGLRKKETEK